MNIAARREDVAAAVLAGLGIVVFDSHVYWPGLALSLAAADILVFRRRLHQPRSWQTTLARWLVGFGLFFEVYFIATAPGAVGLGTF